jgi:hypothetical protein
MALGYGSSSGSRRSDDQALSTFDRTSQQRDGRQDRMVSQETRSYHYDQNGRTLGSHDHVDEAENQGTPKSDDGSDTDSLEDHQLYETTGTPFPFPTNPLVPPSSSLSSTSTYHPHPPPTQTSQVETPPISSSTKTGGKPGRPALPPEIALERKRDRARVHAAEMRRRKKEVEEEESGGGRWLRDLEIEKAVLDERYRRLERE